MTDSERERFDAILEEVMEDLPEGVRALTDEMPIIVEDRPDQKLLDELSKEAGERIEPDELCGLHTGVAFTERSVTISGDLPSEIRLFRDGILAEAGGWAEPGEDAGEVEDSIYEEIRITLLHEIGHQFGLDEDDLERLGYQ
jgi:predicted Zn-dependent protease with MMP-like domain